MSFLSGLLVDDRSFYKKTAIIAIPVTLQSLIAIGISLISTIMLGSLGEAQLAASSLANNFVAIFQILCMGMGFGTAVMTAQYWGSKDKEAIKSAVTIMYRVNIVTALLFMTITLLVPDVIMNIYSNDSEIIGYGIKYLRILAMTYLLQGLSLTTTIILRSYGKVKIPLYCSIAAFLLTIFLSWVFIFGNLGAPRMEIEGAAVAALLARVLEFVVIMGYFLKEKEIGYRTSDFFRRCDDKMKPFMKYAVPVIVSDFLLAIGMSMIAIIVGHISSSFVSANAIIMVVLQIFTVFTQGISNAASIIIGNTIGEGGAEQSFRQGVTFSVLSSIIGIISVLFVQLLAPSVIGFYKVSGETREIAYQLMNALSFTIIFQTVSSVMTKGVLRGGGDTKFLMIADILFLWVASVPLGMLAAYVLHLPPFFIYISLRIDNLLKTIWCIHRLLGKKWIKVIDQGKVEGAYLPQDSMVDFE
ncbi:putative efflux protein, MATE family [Anaerobium acetethylicum]|uniref:Putative efflux protein, MATE family n=1 Tax=Anaerobium acetethylicum TaxID=1619234 RepID=A0A1D3TSV8_9FIRM|nr:putative efflux protein, MATE family [Anaerobium acetethylicum]